MHHFSVEADHDLMATDISIATIPAPKHTRRMHLASTHEQLHMLHSACWCPCRQPAVHRKSRHTRSHMDKHNHTICMPASVSYMSLAPSKNLRKISLKFLAFRISQNFSRAFLVLAVALGPWVPGGTFSPRNWRMRTCQKPVSSNCVHPLLHGYGSLIAVHCNVWFFLTHFFPASSSSGSSASSKGGVTLSSSGFAATCKGGVTLPSSSSSRLGKGGVSCQGCRKRIVKDMFLDVSRFIQVAPHHPRAKPVAEEYPSK